MSDPQRTYLVLHAKGHTATTKPATRAGAEVDIHATPADAWTAYLKMVRANEGPTPKPEAYVIVGAAVAGDLITLDWTSAKSASELLPA